MRKAIPLLVIIVLSHFQSLCLADEVRLGNSSRRATDRMWEWSVFVLGDQRELRQIESVDYILPAEVNPQRLVTRTDYREKFSFVGRSWRSFKILAIITYKREGRRKQLLEHEVVLNESSGRVVKVMNWARKQADNRNRWDWGIWIDEGWDVLEEIEHVQYTLDNTFPNPVREVRNPRTKFELKTDGWGTLPVRIVVFFRDGTTYTTTYQLRFEGVPTSRR